MKEVLWVLATLSTLYFVWYHLIPYLSGKFTLWRAERTIRKVASKHEGTETGQQLTELADKIQELRKEERL